MDATLPGKWTRPRQPTPRTLQRVVRLFRDQLGYDYLGHLTEREDNRSMEGGRKYFDVIDF